MVRGGDGVSDRRIPKRSIRSGLFECEVQTLMGHPSSPRDFKLTFPSLLRPYSIALT